MQPCFLCLWHSFWCDKSWQHMHRSVGEDWGFGINSVTSETVFGNFFQWLLQLQYEPISRNMYECKPIPVSSALFIAVVCWLTDLLLLYFVEFYSYLTSSLDVFWSPLSLSLSLLVCQVSIQRAELPRSFSACISVHLWLTVLHNSVILVFVFNRNCLCVLCELIGVCKCVEIHWLKSTFQSISLQ